MRWETTKIYSDKDFKRLVGIKRSTFDAMIEELELYFKTHRRHPTKGTKAKLSLEDKLLMMLMYYREYRTFFHVSSAYGISESQCYRIVVKLESILIASKKFHLPGKKKLLNNDIPWEVVVVDVSESAVERPKKNNAITTLAKRKNIP